MKGLEFPIIGTKASSTGDVYSNSGSGKIEKFDINSPGGRKEYFEAKVGDEINHIKDFLKDRTFIAYMLGKKGSGKGTYSKLLTEVFGEDKMVTVSVGDLIREADDWENFKKTEKYEKLRKYYRGYVSFDEAVKAHLSRSTSKLLPTEFILALVKAHIDGLQRKSIFIDGLPRDLDQVSYSLYFRDLIAYRDDPDMFVLIDIPESVIDARIKTRVICPKCSLSRNLKLLPTNNVGFDSKKRKFYLLCDNTDCEGNGTEIMVGKEGDDKGIDPIRKRLDKDEEILKKAFDLYGIPKILLRNHVPATEAGKYFDSYELTPDFDYTIDKKGKIKKTEKHWTFKDDNGIESYSLMAAAVVAVFIKQLAEVLGEI